MAKPYVHAQSSAEKFGGKPEDYIAIHDFMDSSKAAMPDNRHRALTHHTWFITVVLDRVFGPAIKNSDGKMIPTRDIGEQHVAEDYGDKFIPSAQDYLQFMEAKPWMSNAGGYPPSADNIEQPFGAKEKNLPPVPPKEKPTAHEKEVRAKVKEVFDSYLEDPSVRGPMRFD